jgi:hypothetical protein
MIASALLRAGSGLAVPPPPNHLVDTMALTDCTDNKPSDTVGYTRINEFQYLPLGAGLYLVSDNHYEADGIFEGGKTKTIKGDTYLVFLIVAGYSKRANWCESIIDQARVTAMDDSWRS